MRRRIHLFLPVQRAYTRCKYKWRCVEPMRQNALCPTDSVGLTRFSKIANLCFQIYVYNNHLQCSSRIQTGRPVVTVPLCQSTESKQR